MKKNVIFRVAAIVVMCALVTACFASSTFARYTSTANTATSTATVAKWDVAVNGDDITVDSPTVKFELFSASNILDTVDGKTDADVKSGLIAPGTKGEYGMTVSNTSEVNAKFKITTDVTNKAGIPINLAVSKVVVDGAEITADSEGYYAIGMNKTATVTYGWEWEIGTDGSDNAYGTADTAPTVSVSATIVVTQVD